MKPKSADTDNSGERGAEQALARHAGYIPGRLATLSALTALLALGACTTTEIDEFRQSETGIESHESIVILGRRQKSDYETESNFIDCVGRVVSTGSNGIQVVPEKEFQDAMFPFFEPRTDRCPWCRSTRPTLTRSPIRG